LVDQLAGFRALTFATIGSANKRGARRISLLPPAHGGWRAAALRRASISARASA
jgi:hypothetical protein